MVKLEEGQHIGNLYSEESSKTSIVTLPMAFLQNIINENKAEYLPKIWKRVCKRILAFNMNELDDKNIFRDLSQDAIRIVCDLCEVKCYTDETVDM